MNLERAIQQLYEQDLRDMETSRQREVECPPPERFWQVIAGESDWGVEQAHVSSCPRCLQLEARLKEAFVASTAPDTSNFSVTVGNIWNAFWSLFKPLRPVLAVGTTVLVAIFSYELFLTSSLREKVSRIDSTQAELIHQNSQLREELDRRSETTDAVTDVLRFRLERLADRQLIEALRSNWGSTSEDSIRYVSAAFKIHQQEVDRHIPMILTDTKTAWFDHVVRRHVNSLSLSDVPVLVPVNAEAFPKSSDKIAASQIIEYFYAQWAVDTFRSTFPQAADGNYDTEVTESVVALIRNRDDAGRSDEIWDRIPSGPQYLVVQVELGGDDVSSGKVIIHLVDTGEKRIHSEHFVFHDSLPPVSVRRTFSRQDYESNSRIEARGGETVDEIVVSFPPGDSARHQVSFLTHGDGLATSKIGGNMAYLCFETKVSHDGHSVPTVRFTTGGIDGDVLTTGIAPQQYGQQWQRVRIPVDLTGTSLWRNGLTITVLGELPDGKTLNVHIRNAYIQPVGGQPRVQEFGSDSV